MEPYHQITQEQRYQIYALRKTGHSNVEITDVIGVHKATVGRELKRNAKVDGYRPYSAHQRAPFQRQRPARRITATATGVEPGIDRRALETGAQLSEQS